LAREVLNFFEQEPDNSTRAPLSTFEFVCRAVVIENTEMVGTLQL